MEAVGFIALTLRVTEERKRFLSRCLELETASFGESFEEALANIKEATLEYLNTIERLGERRRIFEERGITIRKTRPPTVKREYELRPGTFVGPYITKVPLEKVRVSA
jgi:hypothetical protein